MNDNEMHLTFSNDQDADAFEKWLQMDGFAAFCSSNNPNASATLVSNRHSGGITLTGADGPE